MSIAYLILTALAIVASIFGIFLAQKLTQIDKKLDDRECARIDECVITLKQIRAVGHLAEATAIALRDGKTNGEMKTAMDYYTEGRDELNEFILKQAAKQVHAKC